MARRIAIIQGYPDALACGILGFSGIGPIKMSLIEPVEGMDDRERAGWLDTLRGLGEAGA